MADSTQVTPASRAADLRNVLEQLKNRLLRRAITDDEAKRLLAHGLAELSCGRLTLTSSGQRALAELEGQQISTDQQNAKCAKPEMPQQIKPAGGSRCSLFDISQILTSDAVIPASSATTVKELFHEIGAAASDAYGLDAKSVFDALWEREKTASTAMCGGVAIPHARLSGIDVPAGLFVRLENPINFGAADGQNVDLVFIVLSPKNSHAAHLIALARVSRLLVNEQMGKKIRSTSGQFSLYTLITEPEVH